MAKRILLIAYHFPPLNSVASSRTFAFAKYLAELGHKVTVVSPDHKGEGCDFFPQSGEESYSLLTSSVVNHVNRCKSLLCSSQKNNLSETLLNIKHHIKKYLSYKVIGNFLTTGDSWLIKSVKAAMSAASQEKPDVIISSYSPISTHLAAYRLKRAFPSAIWIADYRDLWSGFTCVPLPIFPLSMVQKRLDSFLCRKADAVTTVSTTWKSMIEARCGRPVYLVENGYFTSDRTTGCDYPLELDKKHVFTATGAIYRNRRDPSPFFVALSQLIEAGQLNPREIEVRFYGENSYLLQQIVREYGVEEIVSLRSLVSREESLAIQKQSSALLFLEADDHVSRGCLAVKLFEYLVSGRPILAVGISDEHEAAKVITKTRTGYVCGTDVECIKQAVIEIVGRKSITPDWDEIEKYRRDRLVRKMDKLIEELVATSPRKYSR